MRETLRDRWRRTTKIVGILLILAVVGGASVAMVARPWDERDPYEGIPRVAVRRADLRVVLTTSGRVDSSEKTLIECELENIESRSGGSSFGVNGSSVILEVAPAGVQVKAGAVLCRLDSSSYEEIVRQQAIEVEEERFEKLQADLELQVAETALEEYMEGVRQQTEQDFKGQIALARSDLQRVKERVDWLVRMKTKGYASVAQVVGETTKLQKAEFNLSELEGQYEHFLRFGAPISILTLESQIESAKARLAAETSSVIRQEERLAYYELQVDNCTIRAPHDGFLIYAEEDDDDTRIEIGNTVRRNQDLFYLPDLSEMEVLTTLHESIVDRVREGMPARVRIESLPGYHLEGQVTWISRLPVQERSYFSSEIKNFLARVKLNSIPGGLKPGMTAEVEIEVDQRPDALVIPSRAVAFEGGREVCYVASPSGVIERRDVVVLAGEHDLLEVTEGLDEGEQVILDPMRNYPGLASLGPETIAGTGFLNDPIAAEPILLQ